METTAIKESTISEYVEDYHDLEISTNKLHLKEVFEVDNDSNLTLLSETVMSKYKNDLDELVVTKVFTTEERTRYMCNPWILSYDLYGTTEYWFLLLDLNNMYSASEFTRASVKVYDGSLTNTINAILALEETRININTEEISDD